MYNILIDDTFLYDRYVLSDLDGFIYKKLTTRVRPPNTLHSTRRFGYVTT